MASPAIAVKPGVALFGFLLTETGIRPEQPKTPPTFEQWTQLGDVLQFFEGSLQWLIGAWVSYGEAKFGERAAQAVAVTGWKLETVQQAAWVHQAVSEERRDPALSFSHHRAVADLEPPQQSKMLAKAKREDWSSERLRREVQAEKHPEKKAIWLVVQCVSRADRERLIKRMESEGRATKVPEP